MPCHSGHRDGVLSPPAGLAGDCYPLANKLLMACSGDIDGAITPCYINKADTLCISA